MIPTGAIALDMALGVGGIPRGRMTEIYGQESSGKTTLAYHVVAEAQKRGAWEFIKFLTNTRNATRWSLATGYAPLRKSCLDESDMLAHLEAVPGLQAVYGQLPDAHSEPRNSAWFAGRKYLEEGAIQRVMRGTASPAEALNDTQRMIDNEIAASF